MAAAITIPCPFCDTLNRVPAERRAETGKCGECGKPLFTGHPVDLDAARFERHAGAADLPVLVDFWAAWCGPCKMIAPVVEELAREYDGKLKVAKVDVDANQDIAATFGIMSIPTLLIFNSGRVADQLVGAVPKSVVVDKITRVLERN